MDYGLATHLRVDTETARLLNKDDRIEIIGETIGSTRENHELRGRKDVVALFLHRGNLSTLVHVYMVDCEVVVLPTVNSKATTRRKTALLTSVPSLSDNSNPRPVGRPGKEQGWSATLREGLLYVFSSNAAPFEPDRAYAPFTVTRKLEQPYAMPERGIDALPGVMCQHDFEGNRIFQHRNMRKWTFLMTAAEQVSKIGIAPMLNAALPA